MCQPSMGDEYSVPKEIQLLGENLSQATYPPQILPALPSDW